MISKKKEKLKIAYVPCAKASWLDKRVYDIQEQSLEILKGIPDVEIIYPGFILVTEEDAHKADKIFESHRVDVLLIHFITFSLGTIVPVLTNSREIPVILWSMPEPPMQGGRLSSNSFCASNLNAHILWKQDKKYRFVYGNPEKIRDLLQPVVSVLSTIKNLRKIKIGLLGYRVPGFFTSNFKELELHRVMGIEVHHVSLLELVNEADNVQADDLARAIERYDYISRETISNDEYQKGIRLYLAFKKISLKYNLDAFAVKCWPEFGDIYGIGVCAVLGLLIDDGLLCGCEGDMYGTVNMVIGNMLTGKSPFFCDLISFDETENTGIVWHCGAAAPSLCKDGCSTAFCKHSIIDVGGVRGITHHFPLKEGAVTFSRIGEGKDGFRMLVATGRGLDTTQVLKGNPLNIKFDCSIRDLTGTIISEGFEHHYVVIHENISRELIELCYWLDIKAVEP
jgi:L-fucose isomerase-like protein